MLNEKWERKLNENYNFPGITIYNVVDENGTLRRYEAVPDDGYVMYDTNDENYEWNPEQKKDVPCVCYYELAGFPLNYNFGNFSWVAVLKPENVTEE